MFPLAGLATSPSAEAEFAEISTMPQIASHCYCIGKPLETERDVVMSAGFRAVADV